MWPLLKIQNEFSDFLGTDTDVLSSGNEVHHACNPCVQVPHANIDSEPC